MGPEAHSNKGRGSGQAVRRSLKEAGGGVEGCSNEPEVSGGCRGEGQPEGGKLQGADQDLEARAEFAEKSVQKLQKEVDRLEDELMGEQEKLKGITEELEQTFTARCPKMDLNGNIWQQNQPQNCQSPIFLKSRKFHLLPPCHCRSSIQ